MPFPTASCLKNNMDFSQERLNELQGIFAKKCTLKPKVIRLRNVSQEKHVRRMKIAYQIRQMGGIPNKYSFDPPPANASKAVKSDDRLTTKKVDRPPTPVAEDREGSVLSGRTYACGDSTRSSLDEATKEVRAQVRSSLEESTKDIRLQIRSNLEESKKDIRQLSRSSLEESMKDIRQPTRSSMEESTKDIRQLSRWSLEESTKDIRQLSRPSLEESTKGIRQPFRSSLEESAKDARLGGEVRCSKGCDFEGSLVKGDNALVKRKGGWSKTSEAISPSRNREVLARKRGESNAECDKISSLESVPVSNKSSLGFGCDLDAFVGQNHPMGDCECDVESSDVPLSASDDGKRRTSKIPVAIYRLASFDDCDFASCLPIGRNDAGSDQVARLFSDTAAATTRPCASRNASSISYVVLRSSGGDQPAAERCKTAELRLHAVDKTPDKSLTVASWLNYSRFQPLPGAGNGKDAENGTKGRGHPEADSSGREADKQGHRRLSTFPRKSFKLSLNIVKPLETYEFSGDSESELLDNCSESSLDPNDAEVQGRGSGRSSRKEPERGSDASGGKSTPNSQYFSDEGSQELEAGLDPEAADQDQPGSTPYNLRHPRSWRKDSSSQPGTEEKAEKNRRPKTPRSKKKPYAKTPKLKKAPRQRKIHRQK